VVISGITQSIDYYEIYAVGKLWTGEELIEFWKVNITVSTPAARQ